ncbi:MAG: M48 family metallopeptidase [Pseudomonadota bacterium]
MNIYLVIILGALSFQFILQTIVRILNIKSLSPILPAEFANFYDPQEYQRSQKYTKTNALFNQILTTFSFILVIAFILLGGFNYADLFVRSFVANPIAQGLIFMAILYLANDLILLPFSLYHTFVIEEKFGFNKTSAKTFVIDQLKSYFLLIVIGGPILALLLLFFEKAGQYAWLLAWGLVAIFMVLIQPLFTLVIAPLFNKFTPLEPGGLKTAIENYAQKVKFSLKEISVMDGSKRSSHSNAYFSGIGKKRIALFDTLIAKHSIPELLAIVAHEVGHYKKHHIIKNTVIAIIHSGVLFFLLSLFIKNPELFAAFKMEHTSIYASFIFFALLYSPVEMIISVVLNWLSRKYEYEADQFASQTTQDPESMVLALKNLSVSNLANLTPHPWHVFLNYSHPPILQRIKAIEKF